MSMIAGGDHKARNAFLTNLRDDSSRRVIDATVPNRTQELDPSDILEVKDLANAIERAERSMVTPLPIPAQYSRGLDMFDALGTTDSSSDATDDTSGPALHAPVIPTPIPPAMTAAAAPAPKPSAPIIYVQAEDDAYLQPAPRIRSLADESLQARVEPTLLVRAQGRRRKATTIAAIVFGLAALFMGGAFAANALTGQADAASPPAVATTTIATATIAKTSAPEAKPAEAKSEAKPAAAKPAEAKPEAKPAAAKPADAKPADAKPAVPTFDVKSLPTAKGR